jgi:hypothetical protein
MVGRINPIKAAGHDGSRSVTAIAGVVPPPGYGSSDRNTEYGDADQYDQRNFSKHGSLLSVSLTTLWLKIIRHPYGHFSGRLQ